MTVDKAAPTVTAPTAKTLTYTGSAQQLANAGSTNDGKLYYAVTTVNKAPTDDSLYTTSIPTATDIGTWYVWYRVEGDGNHKNYTASAPVTLTIGQVNKDALNDAIRAAEAFYAEIKENAAYAGIAETLKNAIDAARPVANDANVTEDQVKAAAGSVAEAEKTAKTDKDAVDKAAADKAAAKTVEDLINALPDSAGLADRNAVAAARAAYDALTGDQKKLVGEGVLAKLTAAEEQVRKAEEEARKVNISDCTLIVKDQTYTGKALEPAVTVKYGKTTLKKGTDYTVTYKDNVNPGTATATVKGKGMYTGSAKISFKISLKGTAFTKLTGGNRQITLHWNNQKNVTGYEIQYSLKKSFPDKKTVKIEKASILTATIEELKANKTYYVRIRTYATIQEKNYYSAWSRAMTVKTEAGKAKNASNAQAEEMEALTPGGLVDDGLLPVIGDIDSEAIVMDAA